jgi:hypothetical protein
MSLPLVKVCLSKSRHSPHLSSLGTAVPIDSETLFKRPDGPYAAIAGSITATSAGISTAHASAFIAPAKMHKASAAPSNAQKIADSLKPSTLRHIQLSYIANKNSLYTPALTSHTKTRQVNLHIAH